MMCFWILAGGVPICSPLIWECTRFCLSREAGRNVAGALTLGGVEIMRNFSVAHFAGVFDRRMVRIYRSLGFSPEVIGTQGERGGSASAWGFGNTRLRST